jgi:YidC/Oxa1 family membrane protein insertase
MDKRTVLAVVLSVVVLFLGWFVVPLIFPGTPAAVTTQSSAPSQTSAPAPSAAVEAAPTATPGTAAAPVAAAGTGKVVQLPAAAGSASTTIVRETDYYRLTFSRDGAVVTSIQLKKYKNLDGTPVEMIFPSSSGQYPFAMAFGDYQAQPILGEFALKETTDSAKSVFEFSSNFTSASGVPFTLRKIYTLYPSEYVMELQIVIENSVNDFPNLGAGQFAYTLGIGPQIGPRFTKLDGRSEFRKFDYYEGGKVKEETGLAGKLKELPATPGLTWLGIVGKYFTIIAIPDATQYRYVFDSKKTGESFDRSAMYLERPPLQAAKTKDIFKIYVGPKTRDVLERYNDESKNSLGLDGVRMDAALPNPWLIGWLVPALDWLLELFYKIIPNYGIAIILLTLLTKLVFLPLTFKSSASMARMQALNPKMAEIRARLKDKPDKMNQEIAELYRKEKVNPLGGCLPILLQMPIFFALYSLLFDTFSLRGAMFIPGWIPDLSIPETVISFTLPWGWTGLHLLPVIMVVTQFFFTKFTQTPDTAQQGGQMKIMTYAMPALMFVLMYETPSGLVLYWTVSNILSVLQQLYINYVNKKKKELAVDGGVVNQRRSPK